MTKADTKFGELKEQLQKTHCQSLLYRESIYMNVVLRMEKGFNQIW